MTSMLRTRRPSGSYSLSPLPSYDDSSRGSSIGSSCCPSPEPIDEFSSSEFDEDDIYPVKVFHDNSYYSSASFRQPLGQRQQRQTFWKSLAIRAVAVVLIVAVIAVNVSSWSSNNNNSSNIKSDNGSVVHNLDVAGQELGTSFEEAHRPDSRRLLETTPTSPVMSLSTEEQRRQNAQHQITEQFGAGPHLVEFVLNIWEGEQPKENYFTIEMAPSQIMPVAVLTFLQQVSAGLWDGTSFHINADHVLAARAVSGNGQISKREAFEKSGFLLPLPAEFSPDYPHLPYTLGFVGAGPAFYINKVHNEHDDACFGNVVIGRRTIDLIGKMRGYDYDPTRIRPVDIVSARIVTPQFLNDKAAAEYKANTRAR